MKNETKPQPNPLLRYLPILGWLPQYERVWLRADLIAGLTIVALLIPEGMAYAQIAGVPPQTAFYAAPIGLLAFAIFGSSRQLVVAVSAIIATMSFATVSLIAVPNTPEFILLSARPPWLRSWTVLTRKPNGARSNGRRYAIALLVRLPAIR